MRSLRVAVIGLGRLGQTCAEALLDADKLALAGIVRRPASLGPLSGRLQRFPVAAHVRDLAETDAALLCVPTEFVLPVARELLQAKIPIVECARLEGQALEAHHVALNDAANLHRVAAVVGAGWDPGVLPLLRSAFEILIPHGQTDFTRHPGLRLHHTAAAEHIRGVEAALAGEYRGEGGALQRYVYLELAGDADPAQVEAAIRADPLFAGVATQVFAVDHLSELEANDSQGLVMERRGSAERGAHQSLLLEARFDPTAFAARIMLDALRRLPALHHGAHRYTLGG